MPWSFACLMPHPPLLIPEIGQGREKEIQSTLDALTTLQKSVQALCANKSTIPEVLLILSPHHPYTQGSLFINNAPSIHCHFGRFGAPQVNFTLTTDEEALVELQKHCSKYGLPTHIGTLDDISQDHGLGVPLYFIRKALSHTTGAFVNMSTEDILVKNANAHPPKQSLHKFPLVIAVNPIGLTFNQAFLLGQSLCSLITTKRWGLIASADLSHKLTPSAPAGYHTDALILDTAIVNSLKEGTPEILLSLPAHVIQNAGECGLRSTLAFMGLIGEPANVLAYEGPFGVGYCTALWQPQ